MLCLQRSWITGNKSLFTQGSVWFLPASCYTLTTLWNNMTTFHLWGRLKLDVPSSLDHFSFFQRKTFLSPSLSWKPFFPLPSRDEQSPERENRVSEGFTALEGLSCLYPFLCYVKWVQSQDYWSLQSGIKCQRSEMDYMHHAQRVPWFTWLG